MKRFISNREFLLKDSVLKRCVQDARGLLVMKIVLLVLLFMPDIFWLNEMQSKSKINQSYTLKHIIVFVLCICFWI